MCPSAHRVCSESDGQKSALSMSLDVLDHQGQMSSKLESIIRIFLWEETVKIVIFQNAGHFLSGFGMLNNQMNFTHLFQWIRPFGLNVQVTVATLSPIPRLQLFCQRRYQRRIDAVVIKTTARQWRQGIGLSWKMGVLKGTQVGAVSLFTICIHHSTSCTRDLTHMACPGLGRGWLITTMFLFCGGVTHTFDGIHKATEVCIILAMNCPIWWCSSGIILGMGLTNERGRCIIGCLWRKNIDDRWIVFKGLMMQKVFTRRHHEQLRNFTLSHWGRVTHVCVVN